MLLTSFKVKHYYKNEFKIKKTFTRLIEPENIKDTDEIMRLDKLDKIEIVKILLNIWVLIQNSF